MISKAKQPPVAMAAVAKAFFSEQDNSKNKGSGSELQDFRPIADVADELIRRLWRRQHGAKPCPLDRGRRVVIDGGRR